MPAEHLEKRNTLEHARRYSSLADSIPHMVFRATPGGYLEYHNQVWARYTGQQQGEGMGAGWLDTIHPDDAPTMVEVWKHSIGTGQGYEVEGRFRRFDGIYRWHWVRAEPETNEQGEVIAWLGTITDIHERRSFEEELREARKTAEAANNAKSHFLANMSHEIRTPLNAVMGFSSLLLDSSLSVVDKTRSIAIVQRNCQQLLKIVDELLDLSKVEAGELNVEQTEAPLLDLVHEVSTSMEAQAHRKGIQFRFDISADVPSRLVTDFTRLRQVLLIMVGNGVKFTREGEVAVTTRFYGHDGHCYLEFSVADTGIGIDAKNQDWIFQPFSQADSSATRMFGGTGSGLALARRLARALGGDVVLSQSTPGSGSCFTITIEVVVPADANVESPHDGEVLKGKRILLVEDAEDNQVLIEYFLSQTGAIVELAKNGQEGIDKALRYDYQVVLMDIQMPLVDGYQATRQLRSSGYTRPIIALTAHALQDERDKALETGCNGHLTKPISRPVLIESLLRAIGDG